MTSKARPVPVSGSRWTRARRRAGHQGWQGELAADGGRDSHRAQRSAGRPVGDDRGGRGPAVAGPGRPPSPSWGTDAADGCSADPEPAGRSSGSGSSGEPSIHLCEGVSMSVADSVEDGNDDDDEGHDAQPDGGRVLGKSRMEAFSDGVLAIAITLLVLDIALRPPGTPLQEFLNAWPAYLAYVISFLTIGAAWISSPRPHRPPGSSRCHLLAAEPVVPADRELPAVPDPHGGRRAPERHRQRTRGGRRLRPHAVDDPTPLLRDGCLHTAGPLGGRGRRGPGSRRATPEVPLRHDRLRRRRS